MKFLNFFSIFVGLFYPPGSGSNLDPQTLIVLRVNSMHAFFTFSIACVTRLTCRFLTERVAHVSPQLTLAEFLQK
jgi:hypothetical protein